jgi:hypothetical protein
MGGLYRTVHSSDAEHVVGQTSVGYQTKSSMKPEVFLFVLHFYFVLQFVPFAGNFFTSYNNFSLIGSWLSILFSAMATSEIPEDWSALLYHQSRAQKPSRCIA